MKIIVSTDKTQGKRKNDFNYTFEDEFVYLGMECEGEDIDGECGCRRSFSGMDTMLATTTAKIIDKNITKEEYIKIYFDAMTKAGFDFIDTEDIKIEVDNLIHLANNFEAGTIIEKRGPKLVERLLK